MIFSLVNWFLYSLVLVFMKINVFDGYNVNVNCTAITAYICVFVIYHARYIVVGCCNCWSQNEQYVYSILIISLCISVLNFITITLKYLFKNYHNLLIVRNCYNLLMATILHLKIGSHNFSWLTLTLRTHISIIGLDFIFYIFLYYGVNIWVSC